MKTSRGVAALLGATVVVAGAFVPVRSANASPGGWIHPTSITADAAAVTGLVYSTIVPADGALEGWTGSTATCTAGTISPQAEALALGSLNALRGISGLEPVTFDPALNAQAQAAALVMGARGELSHNPPSSWPCWSQAAYDGASHSNLHSGGPGLSMLSYMDDAGERNYSVGHRRWILNPATDIMGFGATSSTNALYVLTAPDPANTHPDWMPWPPAGNVPVALEPGGRWSLSAPDKTTNFTAATVSMTGPSGALQVTPQPVVNGYGPNTLVWQVTGLPAHEEMQQPQTYRVAVAGVLDAGGAVSTISYDVTLLPHPVVTLTAPPVVTGVLTSGETLRVSHGSWSAPGGSTSFQWFRNGKPVQYAEQGQYRLGLADEGAAMSVRVTRSDIPFYGAGSTVVTVPGTVALGALRVLAAPRLVWNRRQPRFLRVTGPRLSHAGASLRYIWYRNGKRVARSGTARLRVRDSYDGDRFKVTAKATLEGRGSVSTTSKALRVKFRP